MIDYTQIIIALLQGLTAYIVSRNGQKISSTQKSIEGIVSKNSEVRDQMMTEFDKMNQE